MFRRKLFMTIRKKRFKLANYSLLKEGTGSLVITGATTVSELLAQGLIKQLQVDMWNSRVRNADKKAQKASAMGSNLEIASVAIAYFLVNNYGMIPEGSDFHSVRSDKDDKQRKIGFGKKSCEKIIAKVFDSMGIDYNQKVGGVGSARSYVEQVFADLLSQGILTNNKSEVSNNAHVRYGKVSDPLVSDMLPKGFPSDDNFPTLKESIQSWRKFLNEDVNYLSGMSDNKESIMDEFDLETVYYISAPDELKYIADMADFELKSLIDQFAAEAMSQDY
jgi:hypothetical protein